MSPSDEFKSVVNDWAKIYMHRSMQDFRRFMEETGLSFSHVNILMRLFHAGMSGVSDIGEQLGITNAAASQTVDRLVGMGLILRKEDPQDRRARCLELTSKGRSMVESGINARSNWLEKLADQLSSEQQENITSVLILLTEAAVKTPD
jgi:DNA-binding MarR family transcriptional regulator